MQTDTSKDYKRCKRVPAKSIKLKTEIIIRELDLEVQKYLEINEEQGIQYA